MDVENLMKDLKALPEVKLKLIALARDTATAEGGFDPKILAGRYKEISEASDEAESYARETQSATGALKRLLEAS